MCRIDYIIITDKEAVQAIDARVKDERKQAGELGLLFAGRYLLLIGKVDKAKEYLDRAVKLGSNKQVNLCYAFAVFFSPKVEEKYYVIKYVIFICSFTRYFFTRYSK